MPPVGALIGGELAWRQHEGGHSSGPNPTSAVRSEIKNFGRMFGAPSTVFEPMSEGGTARGGQNPL
jgi:hypothetical protein